MGILIHRKFRAGAIIMLCQIALLAGCVATYEPGWQTEDVYWRNNYYNQPYFTPGVTYEAYQPAYHYGVEVYNRYPGRRFEEINDEELRTGWERSHPHTSHMDWEHARHATHAAYAHMAQHNAPQHQDGNNNKNQATWHH